MGLQDKIKNTAEVLVGKAKEAAGKATGSEQLEVEGKLEQAKGSFRQAGEKIKDAGKNVFGK